MGQSGVFKLCHVLHWLGLYSIKTFQVFVRDTSLLFTTEKKVNITLGPEHLTNIHVLKCAAIVNSDATMQREISLKLDIHPGKYIDYELNWYGADMSVNCYSNVYVISCDWCKQ